MTLEDRAAQLSRAEIVALLPKHEALQARTAELERQDEWFKRQLFGRKSERRLLAADEQQLPLAGMLPTHEGLAEAPPRRRKRSRPLSAARALAPRPRGKGKDAYASMRPCRFRKLSWQIPQSLRFLQMPRR